MVEMAHNYIFSPTISALLFSIDRDLELRALVGLVNKKRHKHIDLYKLRALFPDETNRSKRGIYFKVTPL